MLYLAGARMGPCGSVARMFYEDLSEYEYLTEDTFDDRESGLFALWYHPTYARLNVGWLAAGQPYPRGRVPAGLVEKLEAIQRIQWMNVCLGVHVCDLCPPAEGPEGNGEIRIPGEPGIAYAAPFLVTHYIAVHGYKPPAGFVEAVLSVDLDEWAAARWPDVPFPWVPDEVERLLE